MKNTAISILLLGHAGILLFIAYGLPQTSNFEGSTYEAFVKYAIGFAIIGIVFLISAILLLLKKKIGFYLSTTLLFASALVIYFYSFKQQNFSFLTLGALDTTAAFLTLFSVKKKSEEGHQ